MRAETRFFVDTGLDTNLDTSSKKRGFGVNHCC